MSKQCDPEWHAEQVRLYQAEIPAYREYARVLEAILKTACRSYAPLGIVQARSKSVASFAEKAARKAHKYDHPVSQLTDLCGARVITSTSDELQSICSFIRAAFVVDEANSLDAGSRLKESEFGYLSVHYIVQIDRPDILGISVPQDIIGQRKAEIQVRTVTQHAWASLTHDRLYKSTFNVPERLRRLAHRTAALLEEADEALNAFESQIQEYLGSYWAYLGPDRLQSEIDVARLVLAAEPVAENWPALALRLARLLRSAGKRDDAIAVLEPHIEVQGPLRLPILAELGSTLIERSKSGDLSRGQTLLTQAASGSEREDEAVAEVLSLSDRKLLAAALLARANSVTGDEQKSESYSRALELDPADPYILCAQLVHCLVRTRQLAVIDGTRPAILKAIATCRAHIDAGLQLPQAWFTTARLYLLLRQEGDALDAYCKAIRFYTVAPQLTWPELEFQREIEFLARLRDAGGARWPELECADDLLRTAWWLKGDRSVPLEGAGRNGPDRPQFDASQRVLIIAGGTAPHLTEKLKPYSRLIATALDGFQGIVISGGTVSGIPGIVGEGAAQLKRAGSKRFELIGYPPRPLPIGIQASAEYDALVSCDDDTFGLGEPLRVWKDLLASGINPANVRLLGVNGGPITRFEFGLALAFGSLVGLVESSQRAADQVLRDPDWSNQIKLLALPNDPCTAQAFAQVGMYELPEAELMQMAEVVHESYRRGVKPDYRRPSSLPWEVLPDSFRQSSREQAAYMVHLLIRRGYQIEKSQSQEPPVTIPEEQVEALSEVEHGRWNFERLQAGWRLGSEKNDDRKLTPYLVSWEDLTEPIREFDRAAVRAYAKVLAAAGYQLRLPPEP